jgi:hypothetical protein
MQTWQETLTELRIEKAKFSVNFLQSLRNIPPIMLIVVCLVTLSLSFLLYLTLTLILSHYHSSLPSSPLLTTHSLGTPERVASKDISSCRKFSSCEKFTKVAFFFQFSSSHTRNVWYYFPIRNNLFLNSN